MKKILLGILAVVGLVILFALGRYNGIITLDEEVKASWAQVENNYQRRLDLIPNLVATVKGASEFEQETLVGVIEQRANATRTNIDVDNVEAIAEFQENQAGLSQALSRLMSVAESYPTLQSNAQFQNLMTQLEGTENRITVARMDYNTAVKEYNVTVRTFPGNITAMIFGFDVRQEFTAAQGAETAPAVEF